MANFHAIQTTCDAIIRLLQESYRLDLIEPRLNLQFEVYGTEDFKNHMDQGLSLFLYRTHVNSTQRSPLTKSQNGTMNRYLLPLDLHFLLTVWASKASLQHAILGWAMRVLEDNAVLLAPLLNGIRAGVFRDDETVEVVTGELTTEELMRIWDDLGTEYRLSMPYIARVVRIESLLEASEGELIRERQLDYGLVR